MKEQISHIGIKVLSGVEMHFTHVELSVIDEATLAYAGVAVLEKKTWTVVANDHPDARLKATAKAVSEGFRVSSVVSCYS